jgi:imidazoleglycerol-phosphate dehydratase
LNLDGTGLCTVQSPIGFLNHMLASFCKHGMFDLSGVLAGDLDVDQHHLVEDTGIALGMAFAAALGDCRGIYRAGSFLFPMDETLARAAVDFGGRAFLQFNADLSGLPLVTRAQDGKESNFQTDTFEDFWQGFVANSKCNLHLDILRGRSDHHKMEALFKAAARAIREAATLDTRRGNDIPSSKGVIV